MLRTALIAALMVGSTFGPAPAAETATLWGLVFDAAGHPTPGYGVVIEDTASGVTITSPPSSPAGQYEVTVPAGGSYRTIGVVSHGGARFALDAGVPVQARRPVRYRLDVRLPAAAPKPTRTEARAERAAPSSGGADDRAPWWKSPAGIIGLVAVQGAVLGVILLNNDEGETAASPSTP